MSYKGAKWSEGELYFLKNNYSTMSVYELSEYLVKRTENAIRLKAVALGLNKQNKWTENEISIIKSNYDKYTVSEIHKLFLPTRTTAAIRTEIRKLDLYKGWSEAEIELLKRSYGKVKKELLLELFPNRSESSIYKKANSLNLKRKNQLCYTDKEIDILKKYYKKIGAHKIHELYLPDRTPNSISIKACSLNLTKRNKPVKVK